MRLASAEAGMSLTRNLCERCAGSCCQLTVVIDANDAIPPELVQLVDDGPPRMRRADDGACVALDRSTFRCTIYDARPATCRRFVMGGGYCRSIRNEDRVRIEREISLTCY
jgi:Fe-S-cluster containining protein